MERTINLMLSKEDNEYLDEIGGGLDKRLVIKAILRACMELKVDLTGTIKTEEQLKDRIKDAICSGV